MKLGIVAVNFTGSLDVAVLARRAEELGFESFWLPEHTVVPVNARTPYPGSVEGGIPGFMSYMVDPFVGLARAAAVTRRLRLGTCVSLVPEHNPLVLAKRIASLDLLSGGRFIFGVGTGWLAEEAGLFGVDFPHRWTQTRESLLAMKALWTQPNAEFHGRYYDFPPVHSLVQPAQKPHPPIVLGGSAPNVFKRVASLADGWMPIRATPEEVSAGRDALDRLAAAAGRDPAAIEVSAYDPPPHPDNIQALKDAGAQRAVLRLPPPSGPQALVDLENIANRLSRFLS